MGISAGPKITTDGLVYALDASNSKSYSGSGLSVVSLLGGTAGTIYNGSFYDFANRGTFYFDGVNDYIGTGNTTILTGSRFSVSCWVNVLTFGANYASNIIARKYTGFGTVASYLGYTNTFMAGIEQSGGNAEAVVKESNFSSNKWYHYAATFEGSATGNTNKLKIYIDGIQKSLIFDSTVPSAPDQSNTETTIGKFTLSSAFNYFNGKVADVKIYDRELTLQEIQANYNATKNRFFPNENIVRNGLVLNIDASKSNSYAGSGNTSYDLSGFGNTATLVNGTGFTGTNGGAFLFDGTNDYISMGTASYVKPTQLTLACFFKINAINAPNVIVGKQGTGLGAASYALVVQNGKLNFRIESGGIQDASYTFSDTSNYNYAVGTYDGSTMKLYLNGALVGTATTSISIVYSDSYPLLMGYYASAFATNMSIGSLKLYNRPLSATEIQQNFNAMRERYNI
jgi:hypothetical protein